MKGTVDRFEEHKVVVEMDDGEMEVFERSLFPEDLQEGDVVILENGRFIVDEKETKKRKQYIESMFKKLIDKGMV